MGALCVLVSSGYGGLLAQGVCRHFYSRAPRAEKSQVFVGVRPTSIMKDVWYKSRDHRLMIGCAHSGVPSAVVYCNVSLAQTS